MAPAPAAPLLSARAPLASVSNLSAHMEDDMGLRTQPSLAKDSQEMEQILSDLGNGDLVQADLLQAIKTLESGGDSLSAGDPDGMFPLSGFDLPDAVDSEGDAVEDKIKVAQARLERRCAFLQRRLRILQVRAVGKRISEEAAQTFEKCTRGARKDGAGRPLGLKTFLKTIETTATLQASAASRTVAGPKYYNPGTSKGDDSRTASVGIPSGTLNGLEDTAGVLRAHLSVVKHELDSDATASSSGAESNDEAITYNNPHQQHMPIEKRALWSWQRARASIASRWCWLQAQVQELEYKIRQHNDLHKQVREAKGAVEFEDTAASGSVPAAYQGVLPGGDTEMDSCARVRPLRRDTFKKRKLLQMHNLHIATTKAAKPSDVRCSCEYTVESCPVCTGRAEPTQPSAPFSTLPRQHRVAQVDAGYHPVLSDVKDISPMVHLSAMCGRPWFRGRLSRSARGSHNSLASHSSQPAPRHSPLAPHTTTTKIIKRHPGRLKRGRPPLSRKIRERERDEETSTSGQERCGRGRSSTESRAYRRQSYDIDNIVIPQSVAANTRPQILTYKEIITPKWRVMEIPETLLNNGVTKSNRMSVENEEEDVSEAAVAARHTRAERRERNRYMRKRRSRRENDQQHDQQNEPQHELQLQLQHEPEQEPQQEVQNEQQYNDSPAHLASQHDFLPPTPQHDFLPPTPQPPSEHETVRPYSPRQFPLGELTYLGMLAAMPAGHRAASPPPEPEPPEEPCLPHDDTGSSTMSPASLRAFDGDDPDDAEWDPSSEKAERRKSAFR